LGPLSLTIATDEGVARRVTWDEKVDQSRTKTQTLVAVAAAAYTIAPITDVATAGDDMEVGGSMAATTIAAASFVIMYV
jgi:hypothetical protein